MPTPTYIPLANITLGSSASSVTFSSIPGTYRDLVVVLAGTSTAGTNWTLRLNGDTGSNYSEVFMYGTGSSAASGTTTVTTFDFGQIDTTQTLGVAQIMDYSATDKHKTVLTRAANSQYVIAYGARWANTSTVTSVRVGVLANNLATGTVVSLYGIAS